MGKSSSSSSSDSSDDEWRHMPKHEKKMRKKFKKQMRKGRIAPGSVPPWGGTPYYLRPGGRKAAKYGHSYGHPAYGAASYGAPGAYGAPSAYGAPGAYGAQGVPHGAYAHGAPPAAAYGAPAYPAQPYPGQAHPPNVAYPAQPYGAPAQQPYPGQYPAQGHPAQAPPGGYPPPGYGAGGFAPPGQPGDAYSPSAPPASVGPAPVPAQPAPIVYPAAPQGVAPGQVAVSAGAQAPLVYPGSAVPGMPAATIAPHGGSTVAAAAAVPGVVPGMVPGVGGGVQGLGDQLQRVQLDGCADLFRPTVRPAGNFSAEKDCEILRHSMKGAGTDERTIVGIIGQRSNLQRQEIAKFYKTMYGRDIIADLESELSGNFRETIMSLFKPPAYYDAWSLNKAMEGAGTKESVLIEILCTRTNQEVKAIVAAYKEHFKRDLEKDIADDTSGHFKKLLISCSQGNRQELTPQQIQQIRAQGPASVVNLTQVREDAAKLHEAGVKKLGTDESTFIAVLALRHMYQLQATFEEYQKLSGKDLLSAISGETSGDFETGLRAIVRVMKSRPEYFADKLHDSIKGLGTDDSRLIRIIVSRSEIDLQDIKDAYVNKYKKTLESDVADDTSGDYKRLLIAIIGH